MGGVSHDLLDACGNLPVTACSCLWQALKRSEIDIDNDNDYIDARNVGNNNVSGVLTSPAGATIKNGQVRIRQVPRVVQYCELKLILNADSIRGEHRYLTYLLPLLGEKVWYHSVWDIYSRVFEKNAGWDSFLVDISAKCWLQKSSTQQFYVEKEEVTKHHDAIDWSFDTENRAMVLEFEMKHELYFTIVSDSRKASAFVLRKSHTSFRFLCDS